MKRIIGMFFVSVGIIVYLYNENKIDMLAIPITYVLEQYWYFIIMFIGFNLIFASNSKKKRRNK